MTQPNWQSLASGIVVPARPTGGLWTRALDYVAGPRKLKIVAHAGSAWTLLPGCRPGPDGDRSQLANASALTLLPSALPGALIGKFGGSATDNTTPPAPLNPGMPPAPSAAFSVGSFYVVELASNATKGPLFSR